MTRSRLRIDPLGPVLAVVAAVIYWQRGFDGYFSRDLSLYAYAGQQVLAGEPPYEGVVNRSGPLSHLGPALGGLVGRVAGVEDVLAMRATFLVLSAIAIWLAYLLGRDVLGSRLTGVATAMALLSINGFTLYASTGPREKTVLVGFLLAAALALAHRRFGWAGFFVSLATLTWQPSFFPGVATAVVALSLLPRGRRLRGLAAVALGGLLPLAACLVYYAAIGSLRLFLDCFVLIHVSYTEQPGIGTAEGVWMDMVKVYGPSLLVLLVGALAILAGSVLTLRRPDRRREPTDLLVAALGAGLVAGLLWAVRAFNGWPDLFYVLPAVCVGIGYLVREVEARSSRAALAATVAWTLLAGTGAVVYVLTTGNDDLVEQRAEVAAVFSVLPEDASVLSVEAPQALVLTGRTNPLEHQMFSLGLEDYVDDTWPGGLAGMADDIGRLEPTVIARGSIRPGWLQPVLAAEYHEVGTTAGWTWHVHRSVDPDLLEELRRATGED